MIRRPTRPPGRSRHQRYHVDDPTDAFVWREHNLVALGHDGPCDASDAEIARTLATTAYLLGDADDYGTALIRWGYALRLAERLQKS